MTYVRLHSVNGEWVPAAEAFAAAIEECRDLEWVGYIGSSPRARIPITSVITKLLRDELRDIERSKSGPARSARVFFRVRQEGGKEASFR